MLSFSAPGDRMTNEKIWVLSKINKNEVDELARKAGISKLLAKIFLSRGMNDAESIRQFLEPSMGELHDPFLMKDMDKAADRIIEAINKKQKIIVYGDYDVDGITGTSILADFLARAGISADFYIPDRIEEGYGLSAGAIDKIKEQGADLIVTVDCGVTAVDEVDYVSKLGMDIVITDHHECKPVLPKACALVNPHRPDCNYPFKELAGVGVVYKLITALCLKMGLGDMYNRYLDLVAVGTVADVVPLQGENRVIVKHGLKTIEATSNIGLKTLIEISGLKERKIDTWMLSFIIAPRINAAGRIGDAGRAVKLLTTENPQEAMTIAVQLNEENRFRQETEMEIFRQATEIIETDPSYRDEKVLVISGKGWHHGVIGIVSSKITEKYYKPSILFSIDEENAKGSGRSIEGFNLFKALTHCQHLLDKFGGHELAAGLSLNPSRLPDFRKSINEYADSVMKEEDLIPKLKIDVELEADDLNLDSVKELELLAPFGASNPSPVFSYSSFIIKEMRTVGGDKHLKMKLADGDFTVEAIGFNMGNLMDKLSCSYLVDVACSLEINCWNSSEKVQLNLKDIKLSRELLEKNRCLYKLDKYIEFDGPNDYNKVNEILKEIDNQSIEVLVPERKDLVAVYQSLKSFGSNHIRIEDLFIFAARIAENYRLEMNYFKLKKCMEIFEELNLLKIEPLGEYGMSILINEGIKGKTNLEGSVLYRKLQEWKKSSKVFYQ